MCWLQWTGLVSSFDVIVLIKSIYIVQCALLHHYGISSYRLWYESLGVAGSTMEYAMSEPEPLAND